MTRQSRVPIGVPLVFLTDILADNARWHSQHQLKPRICTAQGTSQFAIRQVIKQHTCRPSKHARIAKQITNEHAKSADFWTVSGDVTNTSQNPDNEQSKLCALTKLTNRPTHLSCRPRRHRNVPQSRDKLQDLRQDTRSQRQCPHI